VPAIFIGLQLQNLNLIANKADTGEEIPFFSLLSLAILPNLFAPLKLLSSSLN
jgi:hypothetical protein